MIVGNACGKVILLGEHAVVWGAPALAIGIERGARAWVDESSETSSLRVRTWNTTVAANGTEPLARAFHDLLEASGAASISIEAETTLPPGAGLGCSAALGVAIARAIDPEATPETISERAMAWERVFHGNPSGVDASVAALGGCVLFKKGGPPFRVHHATRLLVCIGHSGRTSETKKMVELVARIRGERRAFVDATFAQIAALVDEGRAALERGDLAALGTALDENHALLRELTLSTDAIDSMCEAARRAGALGAKLTGAGGGGCVIALVHDAAHAAAVISAWRRAGFDGHLATARGADETYETRRTSRLPALHAVTMPARRSLVSEVTGVCAWEMSRALDTGGLDTQTADQIVENVVGTYALPYGLALNVRVNERDHVVPMVVEEPSVVAAASNAAKMVRKGGGFFADVDPPIMTSQIQLVDVRDHDAARAAILSAKNDLLALADAAVPGLVGRGGGARDIEVRRLGEPSDAMIVVHFLVDCRDAMGANLVNTIAEAVADRLATLAHARVGLRILSNLCDRRCVRVRCRVPADALATERTDGPTVADGIVAASRFAELDPFRAATHNKGIMNGIDAVVIATGNDWRAVEAGAHAFAARSGTYAPLSVWRRDGADLAGILELPLALGTVGGTLRVHPGARMSLDLMGVDDAATLAAIAASVGLASNLAALRALATDGIQRGHMALHARSVAVAGGAVGNEVERVAAVLVESRNVTLDAAQRAVSELRARSAGS
jgi:hydroxymethylglutaryl-CoA reductase